MKKSTKQQKIDWLLAHPRIWEGYGNFDTMGGPVSERYTRTVVAMQEAGLWSKRNGGKMRNLGLLISEARKQRRMKLRSAEFARFLKEEDKAMAPWDQETAGLND